MAIFYTSRSIDLALLHLGSIEQEEFDSDDGCNDLMSNMSEQVEAAARKLGFYQDVVGVHAPDDRDMVSRLFDNIRDVYNALGGDDNDDAEKAWAAYGCDGDDDVDYNSGHPAMILEAIDFLQTIEGSRLILTDYLKREFARYFPGHEATVEFATDDDDGETISVTLHISAVRLVFTHITGSDDAWYTFYEQMGDPITVPLMLDRP